MNGLLLHFMERSGTRDYILIRIWIQECLKRISSHCGIGNSPTDKDRILQRVSDRMALVEVCVLRVLLALQLYSYIDS